MATLFARVLIRLAPIAMLCAAAAAWFNDVQQAGPFVLRNLLPLALVTALALINLLRADGSWTGRGWQMPLGIAGFAIPAFGLAAYLHYAYSVNLDGMFDGGAGDFFRYLPIYTIVAGAIGFAIGWIAGRNIV